MITKITALLVLSVSLCLSGCFHYRSVDADTPSTTVTQRTTRTPTSATTTTVTRE